MVSLLESLAVITTLNRLDDFHTQLQIQVVGYHERISRELKEKKNEQAL